MSTLESVVVSDNEIVVITYILGFKNIVTDRYDENKMPIMEKIPIKEKTAIPFDVFKSILKGFPVRECQDYDSRTGAKCHNNTTKQYRITYVPRYIEEFDACCIFATNVNVFLCDDHKSDFDEVK